MLAVTVCKLGLVGLEISSCKPEVAFILEAGLELEFTLTNLKLLLSCLLLVQTKLFSWAGVLLSFDLKLI